MLRREFLRSAVSTAVAPLVPFCPADRKVMHAEFAEKLYRKCRSFKLGKDGFDLIVTTGVQKDGRRNNPSTVRRWHRNLPDSKDERSTHTKP